MIMDLKTATTVLLLTIPFFFGTIWAIVDVGQKNFGSVGKKALWGIISAVPFVGFIVYLIFGFRKGKKNP
jgi:hypothetical protein